MPEARSVCRLLACKRCQNYSKVTLKVLARLPHRCRHNAADVGVKCLHETVYLANRKCRLTLDSSTWLPEGDTPAGGLEELGPVTIAAVGSSSSGACKHKSPFTAQYPKYNNARILLVQSAIASSRRVFTTSAPRLMDQRSLLGH